MPSGIQANGTWLCKPCQLTFSSWVALLKHKANMRSAGKPRHVHCKFCGEDFKTQAAEIKHIQLNHPQAQNLECPGCGKGPFVRLGGLMTHIERECTILVIGDIENLRGHKMDFSSRLQVLTREPIKGNYVDYMPTQAMGYTRSTRGLVRSAYDVESTFGAGSKTEPFWLEKKEFPQLVAPKAPAVTVKKEDEETPWEWPKAKNLFPDAPPAQNPTPEQLKEAASPNPRAMHEALDPHHPEHPTFTVDRYYCTYSNRYTCPASGCMKTFKKALGLLAHLKSPAHSATKYRCPYCLRTFVSLSAITQHAESNGVRCRIRETDTYDVYLDQLTAGMVDVSLDRHEDGTVKFEQSKKFRHEILGSRSTNGEEAGGDPYKGKEIQW
ncbi:hypothetical protein FZEAL_8819 [Fusarium zealandicum]|uniref:C2H2-type domain-containing protein n=1 Tax=Fusarium zealandicum TaxID=1053134 RepID=A0A8H4XHG8_9HYPO|nr:hypothetical protein FZEAL_8819 [Fusarium zealandicum]